MDAIFTIKTYVMKKALLVLAAIIVYYNVFANLNQGSWRWRADDGSETSATWLADEIATPTITSLDNVRLRVELWDSTNDGYTWGFNDVVYLAYSIDNINWDTITNDGSSHAWALAGSSSNVTNLEPTTQQLAGFFNNTFQAGDILVSSQDDTAYVLDDFHKTEFEWVIKPTANVQTSTLYYFRVGQGSVDHNYTPISLVTGESLPITLQSFTVQSEGQHVKLQWTTATEVNNDHFEILRSANGKDNWQSIATQKGSGTSTLAHTYTAYDNSPLNGINYYRIKQYDFDGKSKESEIKNIEMQVVKAFVQVFPNPTKGDISFTLNNFKNGSITAMLSDMKGSVVHKEVIVVNSTINTYKLNLKNKPAPGMYILQLKGNGIEKSIHVLVE